MDTATFLKTAAGALDPHTILRQKPSVLLGVSDAAEQALEKIEVKTVFDLALSRVFGNATSILNAGVTQRDPITGFGAPPNDVVSDGLAGIAIEALRTEPISILEGIGAATAAALEAALDVKSVRDLALWPPYLSSRAILAAAFFPDEIEGTDKEAPADLVPKSGEYPTERIQYSTLVLDEIEEDVSLLKALEDAGPIDISPSATADFGFTKPGVGALLTFNQSWYAQGVALGHLLHSVALAPGESTRIAMVDWSRRTRASTAESLSESEALTNATEHSRALSEVQQAVATEAQSGFSKTSSTASSSEGGGGFGFSLGPITVGGTSSGASSTTNAESFSSSFGRRDLEASMSQNVMDRTQQHATAVRNRRASIVREVSQSEQETVSTRVVANYNHMHALSIQYYEVIQVYRVAVRLSQVDKCLFVPMKLLDFRNQALIAKYRMALAAAALGERYRRLLTTEYGVVAITPNTPRPSPGSIATALGAARFTAVEGAAAMAAPQIAADAMAAPAMASVVGVAAEVPIAAAEAAVPLTRATAAVALRGWDLAQISDVSRIVDRAVIRSGADELTLPDDVALTGFYLNGAQLGKARLEMRDGSAATVSVAAGSVTVGTPTGLGSLGSISLDNPSDKDVRTTLVLQLDHLGRRFTLDVPISLRGGQALGKVISFGATRASSELIDHLEANRLHYSQAVFRRMDASTIALLLSPYEYEGAPVTQVIDPLPIATPGNFLVFRMHADANDGAATGTRDGAPRRGRAARGSWQKWLADHGISMSAVREDIVPLPSGGVFAEAVLGRFNAAEKLDMTRFWNWQDSPIPLQPTDIAPITMGSRGQPENLTPGQFSQPLVNIVSPTALPDPAGLGAVLTAIQNGNMFRDMSGLAATIGLAQAGLQATSEGAGRAGAQAGANLVTAAQKEVEMAKTAVAAMQAMMGNPNAQTGSGANISGQGAMINHGRSLDERGVQGGNTGTSHGSGAAGAATDGAGGSGGGAGAGGTSAGSQGDVDDAAPAPGAGGDGTDVMPGAPDWVPKSYEASAFDSLTWPGLGAPARLMLASTGGGTGGASAAGSSAAVTKIVTDAADQTKSAADRAKGAVQAILDEFYSGDKALVSSIAYSAAQKGLLTTSVGSGATTTGKITVGDDFLTGVTDKYMGRRALQVGHELQHVKQYRQGMTGAQRKDEREFLAHRWAALQPNPAGTKTIPAATRLALVDGALGYYNCLSAQNQTTYKTEKDDLVAERPKYDGKNGNAPVAAPTACVRVA